MQRRADEHKRHLALWVAVGGTMAVIVTLWVLILPLQLRGMGLGGVRGAARWNAASGEGTTASSFSDVLADQRRQLEAIEKNVNAGSPQGSATVKIDELRAKIEAASKKDTAPAENGTANQ